MLRIPFGSATLKGQRAGRVVRHSRESGNPEKDQAQSETETLTLRTLLSSSSALVRNRRAQPDQVCGQIGEHGKEAQQNQIDDG